MGASWKNRGAAHIQIRHTPELKLIIHDPFPPGRAHASAAHMMVYIGEAIFPIYYVSSNMWVQHHTTELQPLHLEDDFVRKPSDRVPRFVCYIPI